MRLFSTLAAAAAVLLAQFPCSDAVPVNISNIHYRYNTSGIVMDAHDGSYNRWTPDGPWYYYAMGYGTCKQGQDMCHGCGYGYSWIGVWKSDTMANGTWTLVREARDDSWPHNVYFRVHTVFNKKTQKYVMWVNLNGGKADYAVGTSSSPEGPFKFSNYANAALRGGGDFDILIDDDEAASAYLIYTNTQHGHTMSLEMLSADYLTSLAAGAPSPPPAPPAPTPPPPPEAGFRTVGTGSCRDASGKEPPFFTDEHGPLEATMTLEKCVGTCKADSSCTGVAFCDKTQAACKGACHLYTTSDTPLSHGWSYSKAQGGDPHKISKLAPGTWWHCYAKQSAEESTIEIATVASAAGAIGSAQHAWQTQVEVPQLTGPVKSNVSSGVFGMGFVEAPAIFKRKGIYYALFGNCCCFCGQGSGIGVHTAPHPLGPWTYHENIGCTIPTSSTIGCGMGKNYGHSLTKAQQNFVIPVQTSGGDTEYIWTGDRWQSGGCPNPALKGTPACNPDAGIKYMDLQYWSPLVFVKDPVSGLELPEQLKWLDWFVIDMAGAA